MTTQSQQRHAADLIRGMVAGLTCGQCGKCGKQSNGGWKVHCPAHSDAQPSLSVTERDGKVLVHCHAGCPQDAVIGALRDRSLWTSPSRDEQPRKRRYEVRDTDGTLVAVHMRQEGPEGKTFVWLGPDGANGLAGVPGAALPLYGAERLAALPDGAPIIVCEGEKATEAMWSLGPAAVGTVTGAGGVPSDASLQPLLRLSPYLWPDADPPGRNHMTRIAVRLVALRAKPRVIAWAEAPEKGDVADYVAQGGTAEGVRALLALAKPWASAVLGAVHGFILRYVVLGKVEADAVTLWAAHTYGIEVIDVTLYLNITSAEKRSGKTRLLEVLSLQVSKPWYTGRTSAAALVRKVAGQAPTLLLDETDRAFKADKEYGEALIGLLNGGYRRGGVATLCIRKGNDWVVVDLPVFSPKAFAGLGNLPDTVKDRSITIVMKRRTPNEKVARFKWRVAQAEAEPVREALALLMSAVHDSLKDAAPAVPEELDDRAAEIWEPLIAIADLAGGDWPARARTAALALSGARDGDDASLRVRLLGDVRSVFKEKGAAVLPSVELVAGLVKMEDAPWGDLQGKPLDARALARFLKPFGIKSKDARVGDGDKVVKAYVSKDFEDAWSRYSPPHSPENSRNTATNTTSDTGGADVAKGVADASATSYAKLDSPRDSDMCSGVAAKTGGMRENGVEV